MKIPFQIGHPTRIGPNAAVMKERLQRIWGASEYVFKFITWIITASVVQFAYDQTHHVLLLLISGIMWLLLTVIAGGVFSISVGVGISRRHGFPSTWYWTVISLALSLGISLPLFWMCQGAISEVIADLIKAAHH